MSSNDRAPHLHLPDLPPTGTLRQVVPAGSCAQPAGQALRTLDRHRTRRTRHEAPALALAVPVLVPRPHRKARPRRRAAPRRERLVWLRPEGQAAGQRRPLRELRPARTPREYVRRAAQDVERDTTVLRVRPEACHRLQPEQLAVPSMQRRIQPCAQRTAHDVEDRAPMSGVRGTDSPLPCGTADLRRLRQRTPGEVPRRRKSRGARC